MILTAKIPMLKSTLSYNYYTGKVQTPLGLYDFDTFTQTIEDLFNIQNNDIYNYSDTLQIYSISYNIHSIINFNSNFIKYDQYDLEANVTYSSNNGIVPIDNTKDYDPNNYKFKFINEKFYYYNSKIYHESGNYYGTADNYHIHFMDGDLLIYSNYIYDGNSNNKISNIPDNDFKVFFVDKVDKVFKGISRDANYNFQLNTISNYNSADDITIDTQNITYDNETNKLSGNIDCFIIENNNVYLIIRDGSTIYTLFYDQEDNQLVFKQKLVMQGSFILYGNLYKIIFDGKGNIYKFQGEKYVLIPELTYRYSSTDSLLYKNKYIISVSPNNKQIIVKNITDTVDFNFAFEKSIYDFSGEEIKTYIKIYKIRKNGYNTRLHLKSVNQNFKFKDDEFETNIELSNWDEETFVDITIVGSGNLNLEANLIGFYKTNERRYSSLSSKIELTNSMTISTS